jgi:hypothetical protein
MFIGASPIYSFRNYAVEEEKPENKGEVRGTPALFSVSFRELRKSYHLKKMGGVGWAYAHHTPQNRASISNFVIY